jgi:glycosyltransferase involved in cell wall biosynthesis
MVGSLRSVYRIRMLVLNSFTYDQRVHREAKALAEAGHDVTVLALWQKGLPTLEANYGYRVIRLRLHSRVWRGGLVAPLIKYLEFATLGWLLAGREPAQVYHAHDANTLPAAWLAARRNRARLVYDAHELETGRNFGHSRLAGIYQRTWAWPERLLVRKADAVLTVSEGISDELVRLYRIRRPLVVMNCPEQRPPQQSTLLRDWLNIPQGFKVALYQGGVVPGRGVGPFLEAIQHLPAVAGVVLGNGPLLPEFRAHAASGRWQRVYLPGPVPWQELPDYTASADLGVSLVEDTCNSYRLSLPNKLFEYLQAGIPVLGSNLPEIARVIRGYDVGELADPDDLQSIISGISRLLCDPERYALAKDNALRAAAVFHWDIEQSKLLDLYKGLD